MVHAAATLQTGRHGRRLTGWLDQFDGGRIRFFSGQKDNSDLLQGINKWPAGNAHAK
jgi:hypothetical protein